MNEGREKPNSQTERRSSNIEVRIPQATSSNEDTAEQELNQSGSVDQPKSLEESETQDHPSHEVTTPEQVDPAESQERVQADTQESLNKKKLEDGEQKQPEDVTNNMDVSEETGQSTLVKSEMKKDDEKRQQIDQSNEPSGSDTKNQTKTSAKGETSEQSDIKDEQVQQETASSGETDAEQNALQEKENEGTDVATEAAKNSEEGAESSLQEKETEKTDRTSVSEQNQAERQEEAKTAEESILPRPEAQQTNDKEKKPEVNSSEDEPTQTAEEDTPRPKEQTKTPDNNQSNKTDTIVETNTNSAGKREPTDIKSTPVEAGELEDTGPKMDVTVPLPSASTDQPSTGTDGQVAEQQRAQSRGSQRESRRSSTASSRNLEAMQAALDTRKESGTGFVLSSQNDNVEHQQSRGRELPEGVEDTRTTTKPKTPTTFVKFQMGKESQDSAYLTETPESNFAPDGRESRGSHTYSPAYIDTGGRRSPEGQQQQKPKKREKIDPKRAKKLERLGISKPPERYSLTLRPLKKDPDPTNKAPLNPNIYYAEVPKKGGHVKTPFYMHVDIPDGALDGKVRLKFERQEFDRMKLGLTEDDTLCSYVVDLNMEPLSYCLRQNATLKMRILDKCINKYEDTIIITARHFSWIRIPTKIESRSVNGEKHYYAVTKSQTFGKFAVINTKKMDRFIVTNAGGNFHSTIIPEIQLQVEEHQLNHHSSQMIEMIVRNVRDEAVKQITEEIPVVKGVEGKMVAASPMIEISKDMMGQTGKMKHGIRFPESIILRLPVPTQQPGQTKNGIPGKRNIIVMQKHTNPHYNTINGHRYHPEAYSRNAAHLWKNVTEASRMAVDGVSFSPSETLDIKVSAPGKYIVLLFEEGQESQNQENQDGVQIEMDLHDLMNAVVETNQEYEMKVMIHQKVSQPSIIFVHAVTSDAIEPISETMQATKAWKRVFVSDTLSMLEWQPIKLEFKGDLQPTVNQMTPQLRFYSKRWQGFQMQLEATNEAFNSDAENFTGTISFVEEGTRALRKTKSTISVGSDGEHHILCEVDVAIDRDHSKPYKPTVVVKTIPKVPVYREYKMKWLKNLSEEEIERYRAAHGI